jgi:pimeloyl-ACP methyl ester carboxylesterase
VHAFLPTLGHCEACRRSSCRVQSTTSSVEAPVLATSQNDAAAATAATTSNKNHSNNNGNRTRDVRFISPLLDYGYRPAVEEYENNTLQHKPLLLYLPGFDGTFLAPFVQFPELSTIFDVRCMTVGVDDQSTFVELREAVIDFLQQELLRPPVENTGNSPASVSASVEGEQISLTASLTSTAAAAFLNVFTRNKESSSSKLVTRRSVYLAGESFGGILALEVSNYLIANKNNAATADIYLQGITLINPATCFDRSRLAAEGPAIADLPAWLYAFGLVKLLPLFTDEHSIQQLVLILTAAALPSVIDTAAREAYMGRVAFSLPFVLPFMKQSTLQWRLTEWLATGCDKVAYDLNEYASKVKIPVLIVAGEKDGTLPSIAEAERLAGILPDVSVHVVEGAGHASTCGSRVDLAALFRNRFPALRPPKSVRSRTTTNKAYHARTAMKDVAANGTGAYFGMTPRYDNASVGLSPLKYWSSSYWKMVNITRVA